MRASGSRSFLTAIVALAMLATMAEVARAGLVVPNSLGTAEGNTNNGYPFSIGDFGLTSQRYQQVYAASDFPESLVITAISFRPDAFFGNPFTSTTLPSIQINLSTTSAAPDALSTTFADNVGLNDETIVFERGPLTLSSSDTGPIGGPKDFDITIVLTSAFFYNPSLGNLLLDVRNFAGGTTTQFDAHDAFGDPLSRGFTVSGNVLSDTADFVESGGLVTMFSTQAMAVPEPSTLFLMSSGLASLAARAWRRRHLRQRPPAAASWRPRREAPTLSENLTLGRPSHRGLILRPCDFERLENWHAPCVSNRQQRPPRDERGETLKGRSQRCVR
jgi:PEP-CTERM motif-containing protein